MPTLVLENLPPDVYECLQRRAAQRQRSAPEETVQLLCQVLQGEATSPCLPDLLPSEAIPAPCDLPMPGQGVQVNARPGDAPLPDPVGFPAVTFANPPGIAREPG
jgi:plasmid stability protein